MAAQNRDRDRQSPQPDEKMSHHDRKQKRKEMREKMRGADEESPRPSSSEPGRKLPLPE